MIRTRFRANNDDEHDNDVVVDVASVATGCSCCSCSRASAATVVVFWLFSSPEKCGCLNLTVRVDVLSLQCNTVTRVLVAQVTCIEVSTTVVKESKTIRTRRGSKRVSHEEWCTSF